MVRHLIAMQYRGFIIEMTRRGDWVFYDIAEPNWHHYADSMDEAIESINDMYGGY